MEVLFLLAILLFSVIVHETSHGYAALSLGDQTAKDAGRLTMNPLAHIDPVGSIFVPAMSLFFGGFVFGWAKPVPYNPYNLRFQKWGPAIVAGAGPCSNLAIAAFFSLVIRFFPFASVSPTWAAQFMVFASSIVFLNILLAVFNLVPIPPLDGSKILFSALPYRYIHIQHFLEKNGLLLILIFIFFFFQSLIPIVRFLFVFLTGIY